MQIHPVFHSSVLQAFRENEPTLRPDAAEPPLPVIIDGKPEYEIDRILDERTRRRKRQYLVLWKGYPQHDATWEDATNLDDTIALQ